MKRYLTFEIGAVAFVVIAAIVLAFAIPTERAGANQNAICKNNLNGTATTSKSYITTGAATTTQTVTNCSDGTVGLDGGAVVLNIISSSTPPSIGVRYEVSLDGIDYYPWPISSNAGVATTTNMLAGANEYVWRAMASSTDMNGTGIASSSPGTATNLIGSTFMQTLILPATPFPYFRLKYYVPVGAPPIALSAHAVIYRQQLAR